MMNFLKNDEGVSPIVATLVLIVVAIIGAAAVAMILGNFSGSVSNQVDSSSNVTSQVASPQTISIAGSTTLYPGEVLLAKDYMTQNPLTKVTVAQGGSDAGIAAVGMSLVDIGASSRALTTTGATADTAKYPNLQQKEVAGSAVVVIYNDAGTTFGATVKGSELKALYETGTIGASLPTTITAVVQRADGSGTEETFAKWLSHYSSSTGTGYTSLDAFSFTGATYSDAEIGNEGVLSKVQSTPNAIGFVDWGYVNNAGKLGKNDEILAINDDVAGGSGKSYGVPNAAQILAQLKGTATAPGGWVPGLVKHCYLITNGAPSTTEQSFITYAASPAGAASFDAAGMFGVTEYS